MAVIRHATFESGTDSHSGWYGNATVAQDSADAQTGTFSLLIGDSDGASGGVIESYPGTGGYVGGQSYDLSLWYRNQTGAPPDIIWTQQWRDGGNVSVGETSQILTGGVTVWTNYTTTVTAPASATKMRWTLEWDAAASGLEWRVDNIVAQDAAAGQSIPIGQSIETDTANAVTPSKKRMIGQSVETDTGNTITPSKSLPIGLAVETDTAQPISVAGSQQIAIGQAIETDTVGSITPSKAGPVGQVLETDTALSLIPSKSLAVGQGLESESAGLFTPSKAGSIGPAAELDTAGSITPVKVLGIGQAIETETALAIIPRKFLVIGQAVEIDVANAITTAGAIATGWPPVVGAPVVHQLALVGTAVLAPPVAVVGTPT